MMKVRTMGRNITMKEETKYEQMNTGKEARELPGGREKSVFQYVETITAV